VPAQPAPSLESSPKRSLGEVPAPSLQSSPKRSLGEVPAQPAEGAAFRRTLTATLPRMPLRRHFLVAAVTVAAIGAAAPVPGDDSIASDETLVTFPTDAWRLADGTWRLPIHAWVYEPEDDSDTRAALIDAFGKALGLDDTARADPVFRARAARFLVDNERGKRLTAEIGRIEKPWPLPRTGDNGHTETVLTSTAALSLPLEGGHVDVTVRPASGGDPAVPARVRLLPPTGISVVSDVDDTIKVTSVRDTRELLLNTFVRPFRAVDGMSELYRQWELADNAIFHYVTGSPWQLHEPLREWLAAERFPSGTLEMRHFRVADGSLLAFLSSPATTKRPTIEAMLANNPGRTFILVGDASEEDPAIYADLAKRFPAQVARILIRNTTDEPPDAPRWAKDFAGVDPGVWTVFTSPSEISALPLRRPPADERAVPGSGATGAKAVDGCSSGWAGGRGRPRYALRRTGMTTFWRLLDSSAAPYGDAVVVAILMAIAAAAALVAVAGRADPSRPRCRRCHGDARVPMPGATRSDAPAAAISPGQAACASRAGAGLGPAPWRSPPRRSRSAWRRSASGSPPLAARGSRSFPSAYSLEA
jgi:hypothetical protein